MISTLTLRFERLLNSLVRGVQLRVCAVGVELCVETCRGLEPGLIGSTAYSKIPTPPYNYMVICRTSNAPTPVGHATPRSCVVLRTPVHVTSPATLHGFNSRYDADPVGWIERRKAAEPTARFAPPHTYTLLARLLLKGVPADWDGLNEQNPRADGTLLRPNAKTR